MAGAVFVGPGRGVRLLAGATGGGDRGAGWRDARNRRRSSFTWVLVGWAVLVPGAATLAGMGWRVGSARWREARGTIVGRLERALRRMTMLRSTDPMHGPC